MLPDPRIRPIVPLCHGRSRRPGRLLAGVQLSSTPRHLDSPLDDTRVSRATMPLPSNATAPAASVCPLPRTASASSWPSPSVANDGAANPEVSSAHRHQLAAARAQLLAPKEPRRPRSAGRALLPPDRGSHDDRAGSAYTRRHECRSRHRRRRPSRISPRARLSPTTFASSRPGIRQRSPPSTLVLVSRRRSRLQDARRCCSATGERQRRRACDVSLAAAGA